MNEESKREFGQVRREYNLNMLDESFLPEDPIRLLEDWMLEATRSGNPDPTAMILSTIGQSGSPSSRIVLLKKIQHDKLIFFTNYHSRKAQDIKNNPNVAGLLFWPELERQVKIKGIAGKLPDAESDLYFSSRPFESKVSAWASNQSEEVPDRAYLEREYQKYLEQFKASGEVPRPEHWGGIAIDPLCIEFWQGGRHRLHDRIEYTLQEDHWRRVRLSP